MARQPVARRAPELTTSTGSFNPGTGGMGLAMIRGRRAVLVVTAVIGLALPGCTKGQTLRGTTSVAVKGELADKHVDYKGSITCSGSDIPISCTGTTTDGRPIAATLASNSSNSCVLTVNVAGKEIVRQTGAKCK